METYYFIKNIQCIPSAYVLPMQLLWYILSTCNDWYLWYINIYGK